MTTRREFVGAATALVATVMTPALAQERLLRRPIPGTGEELPVVGLGNSVVFQEGNMSGSRRLLETLLEFGGAYVDISAASRDVVGGLAAENPRYRELFLGTYLQGGSDDVDRRDARRHASLQGKDSLDLVLTRLIDDYAARADSFIGLKEEGLARYVGVARHMQQYHERMARLIDRAAVDFIQVNYSAFEPEAEERLLPMAADAGVAVLVNRPFINGEYFRIVEGRELPDWAAEIGCDTWAKFSLKFILSHPAVTCVLTETSNPRHARDNLGAGVGSLPDREMRERMRKTLLSFV